jgi:hypothetical protein
MRGNERRDHQRSNNIHDASDPPLPFYRRAPLQSKATSLCLTLTLN